MAKAKAKKKYVPRPVHYPQMVIATHTFDPVEKALDDLIETETLQVDDNGVYVYFDPMGRRYSFESGLFVYICYVEIYCEQSKQVMDVAPLQALLDQIKAKDGFDEEVIMAAKESIRLCKELVSKVSGPDSRAIMAKIRTIVANRREAMKLH